MYSVHLLAANLSVIKTIRTMQKLKDEKLSKLCGFRLQLDMNEVT